MTERIKQSWHQLESGNSTVAGLSKIRFSDKSKCDVYLGLKTPEGYRMLILKVPFSVGKAFDFKYEFRALKFDKIYDTDDSQCLLLNLVLVEHQFTDIFDTLIADILASIINESDIQAILRNYSNRLLKWQSLFEKFKLQGLSDEEQRGLYGELCFLRKFLTANSNSQNVIRSWVGPDKQIKDFQFSKWGVEVKTTHGNNHQKIHINSERQLDTNHLDNLYLNHYSIEIRHHFGETLNNLVDKIAEILSSDFDALNQFRNKLIDVGYLNHQRSLYDDTGYLIRQDTFYKVEGFFPRIEESTIPNGVGDVKYSIIVSQCLDFIRREDEIFQYLTFDER
jgi:hypothetical protein